MSTQPEKSFPHSLFVPYDPKVALYNFGWCGAEEAVPWEHSGWRDEVVAWKETAYIHGHLNPTTTYRIKGPDALKFLSHQCTNSFEVFSVGASKHAIMCNDAGHVMTHGMLLRLGEDEFITYWLDPWISDALEKAQERYDVEGEDLTGTVFLFQIAGPNSLYILEKATGESLRDIGFLRHRPTTVDGRDLRILRIGMAGTLAYELHGPLEDAIPVYNAVLEAGASMGIRRLGVHAYMMNHTENGFPQAGLHFLGGPTTDTEGEAEEIGQSLAEAETSEEGGLKFSGSASDQPELFLRDPVELGWGHMVRLDHEFVGREALERVLAAPTRKTVTLVWNHEDLADVFLSQFGPGESYREMPFSTDHAVQIGHGGDYNIHADLVLKDGKQVGVSSGRVYSQYYREMISMCVLDIEHAELGTEVAVLWGEPGTRQKEIRATVSRYPFLDLDRNENIDVTKLPATPVEHAAASVA